MHYVFDLPLSSTHSSLQLIFLPCTHTFKGNLIRGGHLKGIDTSKKRTLPVPPFVDSPFYLQTLVQQKEENIYSADTLNTERLEDGKAKDLYERV